MAKAENNIVQQSKDFFSKLAMWQKISLFSVVAVAIAGVILLLANTGEDTNYSVLFSDIEPSEGAKIVENLKEKNIPYKLKDGGRTILVDSSQVYEQRLELAKEGLPANGGIGYEIFDKTNLGMSEFVQKLNYRRALEGELARTIGSLNEVQKARVHIVIPEKTLFAKDQKEPSASVILHFKNGKVIDNVSISGIQNLVASSVEGMATSGVTVVDFRGKILSAPPLDGNSVTGLTSQQFAQQVEVEQNITNKVQSLLDGVLGYGNSEVRVSAELDFTQVDRTITDFDPESQVVRSEQSIVDSSKSSDSLSYPAVNMSKGTSNQIANYEISKTVSRVIEGVGNIKRLSVAVLINGTQKVTTVNGVPKAEYIPRTQEEIDKLTDIVKNAVGYDVTRNDQVYLENVPFESLNESLVPEAKEEIPWYQQSDNIKIFGLIGVVLFTIFLIFRLLYSKLMRDRMRIAMRLPQKVSLQEEEVQNDTISETDLEELEFDEDELLLLPAELPEQLLLEGDRVAFGIDEEAERDAELELEGDGTGISQIPETLSEESLLKMELKSRVSNYLNDDPTDAVRLVRILLQQDT